MPGGRLNRRKIYKSKPISGNARMGKSVRSRSSKNHVYGLQHTDLLKNKNQEHGIPKYDVEIDLDECHKYGIDLEENVHVNYFKDIYVILEDIKFHNFINDINEKEQFLDDFKNNIGKKSNEESVDELKVLRDFDSSSLSKSKYTVKETERNSKSGKKIKNSGSEKTTKNIRNQRPFVVEISDSESTEFDEISSKVEQNSQNTPNLNIMRNCSHSFTSLHQEANSDMSMEKSDNERKHKEQEEIFLESSEKEIVSPILKQDKKRNDRNMSPLSKVPTMSVRSEESCDHFLVTRSEKRRLCSVDQLSRGPEKSQSRIVSEITKNNSHLSVCGNTEDLKDTDNRDDQTSIMFRSRPFINSFRHIVQSKGDVVVDKCSKSIPEKIPGLYTLEKLKQNNATLKEQDLIKSLDISKDSSLNILKETTTTKTTLCCKRRNTCLQNQSEKEKVVSKMPRIQLEGKSSAKKVSKLIEVNHSNEKVINEPELEMSREVKTKNKVPIGTLSKQRPVQKLPVICNENFVSIKTPGASKSKTGNNSNLSQLIFEKIKKQSKMTGASPDFSIGHIVSGNQFGSTIETRKGFSPVSLSSRRKENSENFSSITDSVIHSQPVKISNSQITEELIIARDFSCADDSSLGKASHVGKKKSNCLLM